MVYFQQFKKWTTAKKCEYNGKKYDSKFEANYAQNLETLKKAGKIDSFDTHHRIELIVNGYRVGDYYIDFVVYWKDGTIEYVETKGFPSDAWKFKWKVFTALYQDKPNTKIALVWQGKPAKIRKIKKVV
jgi:hypothetical protein